MTTITYDVRCFVCHNIFTVAQEQLETDDHSLLNDLLVEINKAECPFCRLIVDVEQVDRHID